MREIYFITGNLNKLEEVKQLLGDLKGFCIKMKTLDLDEIQSCDVAVVVKHKAQQAFQIVSAPVLVEDTGLYIESPPMHGFPGALIKFYHQKLGNQGIAAQNGGSKAFAETVIGLHDGKCVHTFQGRLKGKIANIPQNGDYGFGWDPIFIPDGHDDLSFAQLPPRQKNAISMRGKAVKELYTYLDKEYRL